MSRQERQARLSTLSLRGQVMILQMSADLALAMMTAAYKRGDWTAGERYQRASEDAHRALSDASRDLHRLEQQIRSVAS